MADPGQTAPCASPPSARSQYNSVESALEPNPPSPPRPTETRRSVTIPANAKLTRPYFSRPDIEQPYYDLSDPKLLGESLRPTPSPSGPSSPTTA